MPTNVTIRADELPLDQLYQACEDAVSDGLLVQDFEELLGEPVPEDITILLKDVVRATVRVAIDGTVEAVNEVIRKRNKH